MRIHLKSDDVPRATNSTRSAPYKRSMRHPGHFFILLLVFTFAGSADAAVIYRWVDKHGTTHYEDVVPDEYKNVARPINATVPSPSREEQDRAIDRAARDKAHAAEVKPSQSPASASSPADAPSAPVTVKRPAFAPTEDTDCETWRHLYRESLECFGPFRTALGATKAEAFEHCTPVSAPPIRCGRNAQ